MTICVLSSGCIVVSLLFSLKVGNYASLCRGVCAYVRTYVLLTVCTLRMHAKENVHLHVRIPHCTHTVQRCVYVCTYMHLHSLLCVHCLEEYVRTCLHDMCSSLCPYPFALCRGVCCVCVIPSTGLSGYVHTYVCMYIRTYVLN